MAIKHLRILKIEAILDENITIPDYQRPYKWTQKHVKQLLEDLKFHFEKGEKEYRLGTVITHSDNSDTKVNIVDGQQRLITLTLILHNLGYTKDLKILECELNHSISHYNIFHNNGFIKDFIEFHFKENGDKFLDYITTKCEMVYICLDEIDEAFQFFDAQNARGKALAPYDLLKAYHLRELQDEYQETTYACIEKWENAVDDDFANLDKIMGNILFRLRCWDKLSKTAEFFRNQHIDKFKGIKNGVSYPYLKEGFQIAQTVINGKWFFDYIEHYRNYYKILFNSHNGILTEINIKDQKLLHFLNSYVGHYRTGDRYIRSLFECLVMQYYDRFGKEELANAIILCFKWSYRIRLKQTRVFFSTIENEVCNVNGLLFHLVKSSTPQEFLSFEIEKYENKFDTKDKSSLVKLLGN
ncbi:DUF262 domain-containing protein [Glaesserella parasuis]|nr:DUF262 domain-containing protein [Glaesserella parasuis]